VKSIAIPIKFGTDGWRGIIAQDFTFDNVRICAQAVADYLKEAGLAKRGLVIGYDTRFASEDFSTAVTEVVTANQIKVFLTPKATPTPVTSFGIVAQQAGGGVVITASHNPAAWNGFKFKTPSGASASSEITAKLEENITRLQDTGKINKLSLARAEKQGLLEYPDLDKAYYRQLNSLVNLHELRQARLKIAVDSMFGAGMGYFTDLLAEGIIEIAEINNQRNPLFPGMQQPEPIAPNLTALSATVKKERASVGLATDGDADRIGIIDENGSFISTLHAFALLCLYLLETRGERGALVKTITMTSMIYRLGEIFKVPVLETKVGFKYVAPIMTREQALAGGEESGGYGFRGHIPERDGILAGLYFLDLMAKSGKSPAQLIDYLHSKVGSHYYQRIDVKFSESRRHKITERVREFSPDSIDGIKVASSDTEDGFRFVLCDHSWLLIRFSNTEPLLRLYAESDSAERVARLLVLAQELASE
jgi:alpha-D-glucose phosphate-specific phosphoglucomutase